MGLSHALFFHPGSVPFVLFSALLLALLVTGMLLRGDRMSRAALLTATALCLPWAMGTSLVLCLQDPVLIEKVGRFYVGSWSLLGAAVLFFVLTIGGNLERYRRLLAGTTAVALTSSIVAWTTDLVVDGVWDLPWGTWYPAAGPLHIPHVAILIFGASVSLALAIRDLDKRRSGPLMRPGIIVSLVVSLGAVDSLLIHHGIGVYPLALVPGIAGVIAVFIALRRYDLLQVRGFDRAAAYELGILVMLVPLVITATWAAIPDGLGGGLLVAIVMLLPLFGGAQAATILIRHRMDTARARVSAGVEQALEAFVESSAELRSDVELAEELVCVLAPALRMSRVRLWITAGERTLRLAGDGGGRAVTLDHDIAQWLIAHRAPLCGSELITRRMGALREPMDALLARLDGDVIVPLVDREALVGVISAMPVARGRALDDAESYVLQEAARAAARTLTFIALFREAEVRLEMTKELEVAAAVQHARTPGEIRRAYEGCEVTGQYHPAAQFGGDWWTSHELPDGRVLVVLGDVSGRGVPAALVSSTAMAACQTAQALLGASCDVVSVLELLNDAVLAVGGEQYGMSAHAALIDAAGGQVHFASAGYPSPYLCRAAAENGRAALSALVTRGTRLGTAEPVLRAASLPIQDGDVLVLASDAVFESANPAGKRYGERRLQHLLRRYAIPSGERMCKLILDDVLLHCGDKPIDDDLAVVVVRVGSYPAAPGPRATTAPPLTR